MFINNIEQSNWIKQRFEMPGIMQMPLQDKRVLLSRLVRSQRWVLGEREREREREGGGVVSSVLGQMPLQDKRVLFSRLV